MLPPPTGLDSGGPRRTALLVRVAGGGVIVAAWLALLVPLVLVGRRAIALWPSWSVYRAQAVAQRSEAEGALLEDHPTLGWVPRAGATWSIDPVPGEHDGGVWRINRLGFRADHDPTPEPAPGITRVVALGDSFTFGTGPREDGWPAQLEAALPGHEVLNLGVPEYDVGQMLALWEERGRALHPHVVVVAVIASDLHRATAPRAHSGRARPLHQLIDGELRRIQVPVPPPVEPGRPLDGPFGFFRFVATGVVQGELHDRPLEPELPKALVAALLRSVRGSGARPVLAYLPIHGSAGGEVPRLLVDVARAESVALVDLEPILTVREDGPPVDGPWFLPDFHHNRAANALLAAALADVIRESLP
jgi:lysophospholipase L1-like esterase